MDTRRAASQATAGRAGRRATLLRYALGLAAIGAVAYFFVRERDLFAGFGATISRLNWVWVVVAFAAELASVPAGVAVAEGYSFARYRRFGADTAVAAWSELAIGAITFCALAVLALVGAVIAGGGAEPILLPVLSVVVAGSAGAALLFRHPQFMLRTLDWSQAHLGPVGRLLGRLTQGFRQTARSLGHVRPSMGLWAAAWGLSVPNWLLDAVCLALSFAAVGARIPWGAVLLAFAGAKVVTSIGITPGGLGVVEGGLVATFVAYGVAGAHAGAAVLVYRALTLIGLVGIGWVAVAVLAVQDRRRAERSRGPGLPAEQAKSGQQRHDGP